MNILFYIDHSIATGFGGQERASGCVAEVLTENDHSCYYIYRMEYSNTECKNRDWMFKDNRNINDLSKRKQEIMQLLQEWEIDAIIVQGVFESVSVWREIITESNLSCKLIFAHHFNPGVEFSYLSYSYYWNIITTANSKRSERFWALKQILSCNRMWKKNVHNMYQNAYYNADKVVLLSSTFVEDWKRIASVTDADKKIRVIPNMLTCINNDANILAKKEKVVLIVSRLEEKQKRISTALKIWKSIERSSDFNDWNLVIVGDGPNTEQYRQYAFKHLKRVSFEGYKEPEDYYRKASVFMMTSAYEGWGLTLTEAQQFGSVPIVMNTFSSAKDIIVNQENGFLVDNEWQFLRKIKQLMTDSEIRERMAKNAIESSHRFEKEKVGKMWLDLLQQ